MRGSCILHHNRLLDKSLQLTYIRGTNKDRIKRQWPTGMWGGHFVLAVSLIQPTKINRMWKTGHTFTRPWGRGRSRSRPPSHRGHHPLASSCSAVQQWCWRQFQLQQCLPCNPTIHQPHHVLLVVPNNVTISTTTPAMSHSHLLHTARDFKLRTQI